MELDEEEIPVVIEEEQKFEAFAVVQQKADDEDDDNQLLDYGNAVAEKIETNDSKEKEIYLQVKQ